MVLIFPRATLVLTFPEESGLPSQACSMTQGHDGSIPGHCPVAPQSQQFGRHSTLILSSFSMPYFCPSSPAYTSHSSLLLTLAQMICYFLGGLTSGYWSHSTYSHEKPQVSQHGQPLTKDSLGQIMKPQHPSSGQL